MSALPFSADLPRHQCFIYEGAPSVHLAEVARTLTEKLRAGHRCLYLNSPPMVAGMRWHLAASGVELARETERGALLLSSDQRHLVAGKFEVARMVGLLEEGLQSALAGGHVGLWAAGDMTWELGSEDNLDRLLEYERSLDAFLEENPALSGICLYHRDTLPAHAIKTALMTHPVVYRGAGLAEINPRYYRGSAKDGE